MDVPEGSRNDPTGTIKQSVKQEFLSNKKLPEKTTPKTESATTDHVVLSTEEKSPRKSLEILTELAKLLNVVIKPEMSLSEIRRTVYTSEMAFINRAIAEGQNKKNCKNQREMAPETDTVDEAFSNFLASYENPKKNSNKRKSQNERNSDEIFKKFKTTNDVIDYYTRKRNDPKRQHILLNAFLDDVEAAHEQLKILNNHQQCKMDNVEKGLSGLATLFTEEKIRDFNYYADEAKMLATMIMDPSTFSARTRAFAAWVVVLKTSVRMRPACKEEWEKIMPDVVKLRNELESNQKSTDCRKVLNERSGARKDNDSHIPTPPLLRPPSLFSAASVMPFSSQIFAPPAAPYYEPSSAEQKSYYQMPPNNPYIFHHFHHQEKNL